MQAERVVDVDRRVRRRVVGALGVALMAGAVAMASASPASAGPGADYVVSCDADDPNGSAQDDRDSREIEVPAGGSVTVLVSDCTWYYASGAISPSGSGVYLGGAATTFTITGAASLNTYVPGYYGFIWTFTEPVTTTTDAPTTTEAPTTTSAPSGGSVTGAAVNSATGGATVPVGGSLRVSGAGFQPGSTVQVWLESTPVLLGQVTADENGEISASFVLAGSTAAGAHHVVLQGTASAGGPAEVSLPITVVAADLPSTGGQTGSSLWLAALLLCTGALTVGAARRRA